MNESQGCLQNSPVYTGSVNDTGVLLKILLQTPTKAILEGVLFQYVLTIQTLLGFKFFMTKHDNGHKVSKVCCKWSKEKSMFLVILYQKVTKKTKKCVKNIQTPFILDQSFYNFKNCLDLFNLDLKSKSSSLTLDSSGRMIVQYTLQTLYTTQKHKIKLQRRIDLLCIRIIQSFYVLEN